MTDHNHDDLRSLFVKLDPIEIDELAETIEALPPRMQMRVWRLMEALLIDEETYGTRRSS